MTSLGPDTPPEELLVHVTVMIALSTALVGMSCFLLGWLKLGAVVRFVPYPVIGGFLAGTGWLLCRGAIAVTADFPLEWGTIPDLFQIGVLPRWLSAVVFAVALPWLSKKYDHWRNIPGSLAVGIIPVAVYGVPFPGANCDRSNGERFSTILKGWAPVWS